MAASAMNVSRNLVPPRGHPLDMMSATRNRSRCLTRPTSPTTNDFCTWPRLSCSRNLPKRRCTATAPALRNMPKQALDRLRHSHASPRCANIVDGHASISKGRCVEKPITCGRCTDAEMPYLNPGGQSRARAQAVGDLLRNKRDSFSKAAPRQSDFNHGTLTI